MILYSTRGKLKEYGEHSWAPTDPEGTRTAITPILGRLRLAVGLFSGSTGIACQGVVSEWG